ncbi:MAG: sensor histidine kinase [Actinobacteria bacterium]|nr:sensor histidine kinase [Actinomycetota bacterium]
MDRHQLEQVPDEYRQLFQFFFVFRAIALVVGLLWLIFKLSHGISYYIPGLFIWAGLLLYTVLIYWKRRELFALIIKHPLLLGVDIFVCIILLLVYNALDSAFYFYSIAPVIIASVLFRFKGAIVSSAILSVSNIVSVLINGFTLQSIFSLRYFSNFLGQTAAYFTVGFMVVYPADMIGEIVRQRQVIREQTEKETIFEERTRFARELHDNLAQILSAIKLKISLLSIKSDNKEATVIDEITKLASLALSDLRDAIYALRSENINQKLDKMLEGHCRRFSSTTGFKIKSNFNFDGTHLSSDQKYEILRICQEALGNASRHSGAVEAKLGVKRIDGKLSIKIEDNGIGFDPPSIQSGIGLLSMRERAEKLGANFEIISAPNKGTQILLAVPLEESEEKIV